MIILLILLMPLILLIATVIARPRAVSVMGLPTAAELAPGRPGLSESRLEKEELLVMGV